VVMGWSTKPRHRATPGQGFDSLSLRQTFERSNLRRRALILARLVPVRTFALGADSRLSLRTLARHPLMGATITFIPFLLDRDHAHELNNILISNILSR
jgi:hypothetical protein